MLTIASWNMNRNPNAWSHLQVLAERHGIDVFLLQEAGRPLQTPERFAVEPDPGDHQRWKILPHRRYCSAIAAVTARVALAPRRAVPLSDAKVDWGEFVASHPGQFAAADVTTPEGDAITVVSLYGIWDKIPETGQLFADATLHRAISDLAVLFDQRGAGKVLVAGDLNVWHAYEGSGERWAQRFHTVFDRLAAHGLPLLGPFRSDDRPPLEGCTVDRRLAGTSTPSGTSGIRRRPRTRTISCSLRSSSRVRLRTTAVSHARTTTSGPTATTAPWSPALN